MAAITTSQFDGGIANNSKTGLNNSCKISRNLDIYSDSDSVTLNPIPVKDSGSTVTDLVKWMVDGTPYDTNRYAIGDTGNVYKITSSNVWSVDRSGATIGDSGAGQGILVFNDYLYYASNTVLGRKGLLSGSASYQDSFLDSSVGLGLDVDQSSTPATPQTYTPPTSISETATNLHALALTRDPIKDIMISIGLKGTGNWTVTVHDVLNTNIGSITINNASLANSTFTTFTFATPIRITIGNAYHFHVTSTVADGTLGTTTASDLTTAYYIEHFGILIADANYHPMIQHTNGVAGTVVIGNGPYIAMWDGLTYNPNKITLQPGFNVRSFVKENEFVVALAWRGTAIDSFEDGMAYYWDGISSYYNYAKPITGGSPNAAINFKNRILSVLGSSGDLNMYTEPFKKIQLAPQLAKGKKIEVLPGAMTLWQGRAHIGYGANTDDSTGLEQGVYEFGNESDRKVSYQDVSTEVLNYGYQISTGTTQSTTMKIGCLYGVGKDMYISWKDASTYGVDRVTKTNNPAATGSWESVISDKSADKQGNLYPAPQKTKLANKLVITFVALPTGCTVTPKYKINRATNFTTGTAVASTDTVNTIAELPINIRYKEIEYGFNVTATVNYPKITGVFLLFDPLIGERQEN